MKETTSNFYQVHSANESNYLPTWVSDVPDDWSHTISVNSDYPVLNRSSYRNKSQAFDEQKHVETGLGDKADSVKAA